MNPNDIYIDPQTGESMLNPQTGEEMTVAEFQATQTQPPDPAEQMARERNSVLAQEFNNASMPTKIGRFAVSMLSPVGAAYAEHKALQGEERELLPTIGAAAADAGLLLLMPLRLGMAGLRAAGVTLPKFATGGLATATANKAAQAGISAVDNVGNAIITTGAENYAGDKDNDYFGLLETGMPATIGAITGARKIQKMDKARGELAASVPQNIRLNEKAGQIVDEGALNLGSSKNRQSIALTEKIFKNPNLSLNEAIAKHADNYAKVMTEKPMVGEIDARLRIDETIPKSQAERNILKSTSDAIDVNREEILTDLQNLGYLDQHGIKFDQLDKIRKYLNNIINWNKNQQGLARSAPQEKAARELYSEINQSLDKGIGNFVFPNEAKRAETAFMEYRQMVGDDNVRAMPEYNFREFNERRAWDNRLHDNLIEGDLLTGIASKRAIKDAKSSGDYFPMRNVNPTDARNVNLYDELMPNLLSSRFQERDLEQNAQPKPTQIQKQIKEAEKTIKDPVEQYLFLADKHGKNFGPASEFYKTLSKEQQAQAMERLLTGE